VGKEIAELGIERKPLQFQSQKNLSKTKEGTMGKVKNKSGWDFKDPNRKSNRMKSIEMPMQKVIEARHKKYDEVIARGGSQMQGLIAAWEIVPTINKRQPTKRRSKK
tara:strand:- start:2553 stop:2873 length:321 start_codon:yes stop_codon:yes gene_type:complete